MALPQLHPLPLQRQQPSAPLRLTTAASGLGYVCVAVAPRRIHLVRRVKEVTGLILDLCSELVLDQYSFYKGSDLSFITISTNWPSPGMGGGGGGASLSCPLSPCNVHKWLSLCHRPHNFTDVLGVGQGFGRNFDSEAPTRRERGCFSSSLLYSQALCSPAYLSEHVDHVDCSGGRCAQGVINGMMQWPVLLHRGPHMCTPPSFIYHFAFFFCQWNMLGSPASHLGSCRSSAYRCKQSHMRSGSWFVCLCVCTRYTDCWNM